MASTLKEVKSLLSNIASLSFLNTDLSDQIYEFLESGDMLFDNDEYFLDILSQVNSSILDEIHQNR